MDQRRKATNYQLEVSGGIASQVRFWADDSKFRAYIAGFGAGKTFGGVVAVWMMPPFSVGMVVAPTYRMLQDATQRPFFTHTPKELIKSHNKSEKLTILANGTEIMWRSADNPDSLRGPSIGWLWGDEWAMVSLAAHQICVSRLREEPGKAWFTSTPRGLNWLHNWAVSRGRASLHHAHTRDNPYNIKGYAEDLELEYEDDPRAAAQELAGQFVDLSGTKRFNGIKVDACYKYQEPLPYPDELEQIVGIHEELFIVPETLRLYVEPEEGVEYTIGVDCAEGIRGGDDAALVVVEKVTGIVCAILAGLYEPCEEWPSYIAILARWYNDAVVLYERNNHGHATGGGLDRLGVDILEGPDGRMGWVTSAQSKATMCSAAYKTIKDAAYAWTTLFDVGPFDGVTTAERDAKKKEARTFRKMFPDHRLKEQIKGIDRKTLKGPGKGHKKGVDDEFIAWALADMARSMLSADEAMTVVVF